jgi:membrane fusion protein YbhG
MAMNKKRLIGIAAAVAIAAAGGYACFDFWQAEHTTPNELTLYGNVDIREADLAFNVAGRVETMLVEEGDEVSKGQLLAKIEPETYQAEVDVAEAQIAAQHATLNRLLAGSRPEEIKESRANVEAIAADLEDARATLRRTEKLATSQVAALQTLDQNRARVKSLDAQLNAAQQRLSLAIQGPRSEDIAFARAQLQVQQSELTLALQRIEYTKLVAKNRGVIKTRIVEPGAVVLAQVPVYTMALVDPMWVRTYVPEPDLGKIHSGMKAQIFTDSAPTKAYDGWIGFISPVAEFTPKTVETPEIRTSLVYRVRVYVKDPDHGLRQGMPVTVRLKLEPTDAKPEKAGLTDSSTDGTRR